VAPATLWPEASAVGVVRLHLEDLTLIDTNGRLLSVPTADEVPYSRGNTVEFSESAGVLRVLAQESIRPLDLPAVEENVADRFKVDSSVNASLDFEDFGGSQVVVDRARELIETPLKHREKLAVIGARPIKGVLFTGPPGTGKTMLARIIAGRTDAAFYEISGPEIFSKWYGQSEEVLRAIFRAAAAQPKAIIFFDEIDSVAGQRGDESHEASKRVVAQLLSEMDGFSRNDNVVVIATTNRPQDIDRALRRPGRFDWEIPFGFPDRADREAILIASGKTLQVGSDLPHAAVAEQTDGWSAAELTAIWSEAALAAVVDGREAIETEDCYEGFRRVAELRRRVEVATAIDSRSL
jgi:transitional endoplasmic reticulum ATPase